MTMKRILIAIILASPIMAGSDCGAYDPPHVQQDAGKRVPSERSCEYDSDCEPDEWCPSYRGRDAVCTLCDGPCE